MKSSLLSRLRRNGALYLLSALLLLLGLPLYQTLVLSPRGYADVLGALAAAHFAPYLAWIHSHLAVFLLYRLLLILAFALLISFPFSLFRIIVAQEILGQEEREQEAKAVKTENDEGNEEAEETEGDKDDEEVARDSMPPYAWRGKGFAVLAAWAGLFGLLIYVAGALVGSVYIAIISNGFSGEATLPPNVAAFSNFFTLATNTVGLGLLAMATLFFGAMIARSGRNLWPTSWVLFSYLALAVAALLSGEAISVAGTPTAGQSALTTPAVLLFALWILWLAIMLVRLKPEP
jgi:hypothetical protein